MCLAMTRKILSAHSTVTHHQWLREEHRGIELKARTFNIIGLGHMGKQLHKVNIHGCKLIAHDTALEHSPMKEVQLVS
jgi:D-3-phosphoglycerate dehydrogenase